MKAPTPMMPNLLGKFFFLSSMFSPFLNSIRFYAVKGHDNSLVWYTCFWPQNGQGLLMATFASRVLLPASSVVTPRFSSIWKSELSNTWFLFGQKNTNSTSFTFVIKKYPLAKFPVCSPFIFCADRPNNYLGPFPAPSTSPLNTIRKSLSLRLCIKPSISSSPSIFSSSMGFA
jgi:hypothetical protein